MEWTLVTALCAAATVAGGAFGAVVHHAYARGNFDTGLATKVASLDALTTATISKTERLSAELHDYKMVTSAAIARMEANLSATSTAQIAAEHRIAKAIEDFGAAINNMTTRIDRVLEARTG